MNLGLSLKEIPKNQYKQHKDRVIFDGYKWDPQVEDTNTIANNVILLEKDTALYLEKIAEELSHEVLTMETALLNKLSLTKELGLPSKIHRNLPLLRKSQDNPGIRIMRFDFHPSDNGWKLSEVNSDVPAGLPEASILPQLTERFFPEYQAGKNTVEKLYEAYRKEVTLGLPIIFLHATAYSEETQIISCLTDYFSNKGYYTIAGSPNHLTWIDKEAYFDDIKLGAIYRRYPFEWLSSLKNKKIWLGYYDNKTLSCNPARAILSQSKRLPLVWDKLGVDIPTWKQFLPKTLDPLKGVKDGNWIYKPAMGRVGDSITIESTMESKKISKIKEYVFKKPQNWVMQEKFNSQALVSKEGIAYHLCIGVFTINEKSAGFYARASLYPRIDEKALDIAVLIKKER